MTELRTGIALDEFLTTLQEVAPGIRERLMTTALGEPVSRLDLIIVGAAVVDAQNALFDVLVAMPGHDAHSVEALRKADKSLGRLSDIFRRTTKLDDAALQMQATFSEQKP